jgi:dienelactone hydrolase
VHKERFAGVIAFYPLCVVGPRFGAPTLIFVGDQDPISPAALCKELTDKNVEVVVYSGATHGFAMPGLDTTFLGSHVVYDERATHDAQQRIDGFLKAHGAEVSSPN